MISTEKVAGAGADMAADQDVPLQADHHQPGHDFEDQDADNDDGYADDGDADDDYTDDDGDDADDDDDVKYDQIYSAAGARPGESFEGRRRVVGADETQPRAAVAQMGQLSA